MKQQIIGNHRNGITNDSLVGLSKVPLNRVGILISFFLGFVTAHVLQQYTTFSNETNGQQREQREQREQPIIHCNCSDVRTLESSTLQSSSTDFSPINDNPTSNDRPKQSSSSSVWDVQPFEHTAHHEIIEGVVSDAYNPIMNYFHVLYQKRSTDLVRGFDELPQMHSWLHFFEAYHNHFARFRGKDRVIFMEVGVQSGGKIPMLRDYFGPGFRYIGIDINPSTLKFNSSDWISIEIGDSSDRQFWQKMRNKYPHVDIFLDDGGHTMQQQTVTIQEMLPHVHSEGIFMCEDLATSWSTKFGGIPRSDSRHAKFIQETMFGLIHQTIDWLHYQWISGTSAMIPSDVSDQFFGQNALWWRIIPQQVKHIHIYNQMVVYEKGLVYKPQAIKTVGSRIPYQESGIHEPVDWLPILTKLQTYTNSPWNWTKDTVQS